MEIAKEIANKRPDLRTVLAQRIACAVLSYTTGVKFETLIKREKEALEDIGELWLALADIVIGIGRKKNK